MPLSPAEATPHWHSQVSRACFLDYPKVGQWLDTYVLTANGVGCPAFSYIIALPRQALLQGSRSVNAQVFSRPWEGDYLTTNLPADLDGLMEPVAGSPHPIATLRYVYSLDVGAWEAYLNVLKLRVDLSNPSQSGLYGPLRLDSRRFTMLTRDAPQKGSSINLYALYSQLMNHFAYRRFATYDAAVVSHTVDVGNSSVPQAAVQWYELRGLTAGDADPYIYQQGVHAPPDDTSRFMSTMAMDKSGGIALAYAISGPSRFPGLAVTGRVANGTLGTMTEAETVIKAGEAASGHRRWGDYFSMAVDVDDCTFWYVGQYMTSAGGYVWGTRVVNFTFPGCK
jgi:hypothetical protein